jgi:hypothetical protein
MGISRLRLEMIGSDGACYVLYNFCETLPRKPLVLPSGKLALYLRAEYWLQ